MDECQLVWWGVLVTPDATQIPNHRWWGLKKTGLYSAVFSVLTLLGILVYKHQKKGQRSNGLISVRQLRNTCYFTMGLMASLWHVWGALQNCGSDERGKASIHTKWGDSSVLKTAPYIILILHCHLIELKIQAFDADPICIRLSHALHNAASDEVILFNCLNWPIQRMHIILQPSKQMTVPFNSIRHIIHRTYRI